MIEFFKKHTSLLFLGILILIALFYGLRLRASLQKPASTVLTYTDSDYHFSFEYGKEFKVRGIQDPSGGKVILAEEPQGKNSFQINITAFDDSNPLTEERILKELPNIPMEEIRTIRIGKQSDIEALGFFSKDPQVGDIYTVWFARQHHLYQVSGLRKTQVGIIALLKTFSFAS